MLPRGCSRFLIVLGFFLAAAPQCLAQTKSEGGEVYKRLLQSTVWILAPDGHTGTGALIDGEKGIVLTCYHLVKENEQVALLFPVFQNGKLVPERAFYEQLLTNRRYIRGAVVARAPEVDLALIRLETLPQGVKPLALAKESPGPGEAVHSVGNPGASGALWVYTEGKVRQVYRSRFKLLDGNGQVAQLVDSKLIETQSPTNSGDSGGPLVNDRGELIGVTIGGAKQAQLITKFTDLSEIKALLASVQLRPKAPEGVGAKAAAGPASSAEQLAATVSALSALSTEAGEREAGELTRELLKAAQPRQDEIIQILKEAKGVAFSEALADVIAQLSGRARDQAREALAERLTRMSAKTLRGFMKHDDREIRRAASSACERKAAKDLIPDIIPLLDDTDSSVSLAAYEALKGLTGKDLGRYSAVWKARWDK